MMMMKEGKPINAEGYQRQTEKKSTKEVETTKVGEIVGDKFVEGREKGDNQNQRKEIKLPHNKVEIIG